MRINPVIYVVVGIVALGGLFLLFRPQQQTQPSQTIPQSTTTPTQVASPTSGSNIKTFELVIKNKKILTGPDTIKVNKGDKITIKVTADEAEEFHVHAYDKSIGLEPNTQATLTFTANLSGRFPFELEKSKTELGALEVQPK